MKIHRIFYTTLSLVLLWGGLQAGPAKDRAYWVKTMTRIVEPVFVNLSQNTLRANMPVETIEGWENRREVTHLEALGRAFCGIAPWLNLGPDDTKEGKLRARYIDLCVRAISNAVDPSSPDYLRFDSPAPQPKVDAAFFAHGLLRSKDQIWPRLDDITRERVIESLKSVRKITAGGGNWLFFAAMIETALLEFTGECNFRSIEFAIAKFKQWYQGDGWYGDGPSFHFDYYNSYVIQPMFLDILAVLRDRGIDGGKFYPTQLKRFVRHAVQQERLISPEGTYPVIGRSMGYRFGAFQVLAQAALQKLLPDYIEPAQVRCALTAVLKRQLVKENFDDEGWLRLGFCGHQPSIAEGYVSTGSCYLCTFVFLPLGLDPQDEFWTAPPAPWTSQKAWSGQPLVRDYAI